MTGDYYEGLEEGIAIGRREALEAAAKEAARPAGNGLMDFDTRQAIIVRRVKAARVTVPECSTREEQK